MEDLKEGLIKDGRICWLWSEGRADIGEIRDIPYRPPSDPQFRSDKHRLDIYLPKNLMEDIKDQVNLYKRTKVSQSAKTYKALEEDTSPDAGDRKGEVADRDLSKEAKQSDSLVPVVVFVHGGGWQRGDRRSATGMYQNVGRAFSSAGYVTVIPSYRLTTPSMATVIRISLVFSILVGGLVSAALSVSGYLRAELAWVALAVFFLWIIMASNMVYAYRVDILSKANTKFPRHAHDVSDAIVWVQKNIEKFGGDPKRIFFSGHSAGGHLVSLLSLDRSYLRDRGFDFSALKACISISGVYSSKLFTTNAMTRRMYLFRVFGDDESKWDTMFCSNHACAEAPSFLLLNASIDFGLIGHSEELEAKLKELNVPVERYIFNYTNHITIVSRIGGKYILFNMCGERIGSFVDSFVSMYSRMFGSTVESTHNLECMGLADSSMRVTSVVVRRDAISKTILDFINKKLSQTEAPRTCKEVDPKSS